MYKNLKEALLLEIASQNTVINLNEPLDGILILAYLKNVYALLTPFAGYNC